MNQLLKTIDITTNRVGAAETLQSIEAEIHIIGMIQIYFLFQKKIQKR
jgi:hypothetical protein